VIYIVATSYAHYRYNFINQSTLLLSGNQQKDIHEIRQPAAAATLRPEHDEVAAPCIAITLQKDLERIDKYRQEVSAEYHHNHPFASLLMALAFR
jgi:hypothetical protein